jgi:hypothetical protein
MTISPIAETRANELFGSLTADADFDLPAIDLTGSEYQAPSSVDNPLYAAVSGLTEADLTTRVVGGSGVFDGLMEAIRGHLTLEYEKGRITGKEYADVYVAMTQAALGNAVQYLVSMESTYWQAQLTQMQARAAEAMAVSAKIDLEINKSKLNIARIETQSAASNYALSKMKLASEDAAYALAQRQDARADYELTSMLPKQVLQIESQIDVASAQISETTARKDQVLYQTSALLPAQKLSVDAETAVKTYQTTNLLPAQKDGILEETAGKAYTNQFLLPEQLGLLREQVESQRAKTLDTRTDGVTPISGAMGQQANLYAQQIDSYKRDAETKVAKMLLDTWVTQKSMDEGLIPPSSLTDVNINTVMTKIRSNLDLS